MSLSVNFQSMDFARLVRLVRLVRGNITLKSVNIHQTVSKSKHVKEDTQNHAKGLPLVIADLLLSVHTTIKVCQKSKIYVNIQKRLTC